MNHEEHTLPVKKEDMSATDHPGSVFRVTSEHGLSYAQSVIADVECTGTTDNASVPAPSSPDDGTPPARLEPLSGSLVGLGFGIMDPVLRRVFFDESVTATTNQDGDGLLGPASAASSSTREGDLNNPRTIMDGNDPTRECRLTEEEVVAPHNSWAARNQSSTNHTNTPRTRFAPYSKPTGLSPSSRLSRLSRLSIDMLPTYIPGGGSFKNYPRLVEAAPTRVMNLTPETRRFPPARTTGKAAKLHWRMLGGTTASRENELQPHQGARIMNLTPETRRFPPARTLKKDYEDTNEEAGKVLLKNLAGPPAREAHESPAASPGTGSQGSPFGSTDSSTTSIALRPRPEDLGKLSGSLHSPTKSYVPDEDDGDSCSSSGDDESEDLNETTRKAMHDVLVGPSYSVNTSQSQVHNGPSGSTASFSPAAPNLDSANLRNVPKSSPPRVFSFIPDARRFPPANTSLNKRKRGDDYEGEGECPSRDGADGVGRKERRLLPSLTEDDSVPAVLPGPTRPTSVDSKFPTTPACRRSHSEPPSQSFLSSSTPSSRVPVIWKTPTPGRAAWYQVQGNEEVRTGDEYALAPSTAFRAASEETQSVCEFEDEGGRMLEDGDGALDLDVEDEKEEVMIDRVICKLERYVERSEKDVAKWIGTREMVRDGRKGVLGTSGRDD